MDKRAIYQAITERIVTAIESGEGAVWHKPWKTTGGYPVNIRSKRPYRGINVLLLMLANFGDPRWGTYKAIKEAGGQVRKGEKGTTVILWKPAKHRGVDEAGEATSEGYLLLRNFTVFNAKQCDGLPELPGEEERAFTPIETAEALLKRYVWGYGEDGLGPSVMYGYDAAGYSLARDQVVMPEATRFDSDESFYSTLFHELVHSTGHESRLKRIEPALFGTDPYSREELVAELGASFLGGLAGFETAGGDQSAAYIAGWLEPLKNDPSLVPMAAAQAQKAVDLIIGTTFDDDRADEDTAANQDGRVRVGS